MRVYDMPCVNHLSSENSGRPDHEALVCALCPANTILIFRSTSSVPPPSPTLIMSQTTSTTEASSRFQAIFQTSLKSYQKQTKSDLLAHPLVSQLQSCDSTAAIVGMLQGQVQELDKSRSGDERLTKWLNPTVNVLSAFSATVSGGVSLVLILI
jgi:hypothetical protein